MNNLGKGLFDVGRLEDAPAASQEAVHIYRGLAQMRPDAPLRELATTLNTISGRLAAFDRREEALAASHEAVEIYRRLAQARPDAFLRELATSLDNISVRLAEHGRGEEAVAASQEAADIRKRLGDTELRVQLARMRQEIRDLDAAIEALQASPSADILQVQRLKKRKLALRDRISFIEDQLIPDVLS